MSRPLPMGSVMRELEVWGAKKSLGVEVYALTTEIRYAQIMLGFAGSKETGNPSLDYLLLRLQEVVNDAYVVLNELDYFRVQDELRHGTSRGVDEPPKGWLDRLHFHARHAARAAAAKLKPSSSSHDNAELFEKLASVDIISSACCVGNGPLVQDVKAPKPKFNRVVLSTKMTEIVEKLKSLSSKVSDVINIRLISGADVLHNI